MVNYLLLNVVLILMYMYYFYKLKHGFHMLQLESYMNDRYKTWMNKNKKEKVTVRDLILVIPAIASIFNTTAGLIVGIIFVALLYISRQIYKVKKPLVYTKRVKRLFITGTIIFLIPVIIGNILLIPAIFENTIIKMVGLPITLLFLSIILILSTYLIMLINNINKPIEKSINNGFIKNAKKKLKDANNLKVIGITGSYGKTTTKYIVASILSQKYNTLMTPESYNTTLGVVRTINEKLENTHEIFVCEMGAKNIGDIKEICDIVSPEYGILTAIGPQHLETFKSLENVQKTKMELVDSLPANGIAFVNNEDENIKKINFEKNNVKYGLDNNSEYYAYNIRIEESGSVFDVHTPTAEITNIKTKLLGEHSILNIVGAIAVAQHLGLNSDEIKAGIRFLKPVPHRLELKRNPNGLLIIDDAYNSNIKGAKMAVKTLGRFENRTRILVTPGMVDLGEFAEKYNSEFAEEATKYCDFIILVGEKQAINLNKGIERTNYPKEKVYVAKDINDAFKKLAEFDASKAVVLLENDLPDNYL